MTSATRDAAARTQVTAATESLERPSAVGANAPAFGSDVAAEALRDLNIPYIALAIIIWGFVWGVVLRVAAPAVHAKIGRLVFNE